MVAVSPALFQHLLLLPSIIHPFLGTTRRLMTLTLASLADPAVVEVLASMAHRRAKGSLAEFASNGQSTFSTCPYLLVGALGHEQSSRTDGPWRPRAHLGGAQSRSDRLRRTRGPAGQRPAHGRLVDVDRRHQRSQGACRSACGRTAGEQPPAASWVQHRTTAQRSQLAPDWPTQPEPRWRVL